MENARKEAVVSFLRLVVSGKIRQAYDKYISPDFRHHNPYFRGDRQSLMDAMEKAQQENPNKTLDIKRVLQDGYIVATISQVKQRPDDNGIAVVHIFRFEDDAIVEMWDIGQEIPKDSPNENGMF